MMPPLLLADLRLIEVAAVAPQPSPTHHYRRTPRRLRLAASSASRSAQHRQAPGLGETLRRAAIPTPAAPRSTRPAGRVVAVTRCQFARAQRAPLRQHLLPPHPDRPPGRPAHASPADTGPPPHGCSTAPATTNVTAVPAPAYAPGATRPGRCDPTRPSRTRCASSPRYTHLRKTPIAANAAASASVG